MKKMDKSEKHMIDEAYFRKLDTESKIMEIAKNFDTPAGKNQNDVLEAIMARTEKEVPVLKMRNLTWVRTVAALALILIGIYAVNTVFSKDKVATGFGEQAELKLPDNSKVVLNADSKLTYSARTFNQSRQLKLSGEAFFDVQKGGEFVIDTRNGKIEILGTQLNVYSRGNEFWVSCLRGKVKVSSGDEEQIIEPGELVQLSDRRLVKKVKSDIDHTAAWKQGIFYFEDKPLVSIFEAIERQFNVSVNYQGNEDRTITVTFSNKNLQEALDVICIPMGLKYDIRNNKVFISEKSS